MTFSKPMTRSAIRAMEATWPMELVVCKRIAEVIGEGHPMAFKQMHGVEPVKKYPYGAIVAIASMPTGLRKIEVSYCHTPAFKGEDHVVGITFRAFVKKGVLQLEVPISREDFGNEDERRKLIQFIGDRLVHACAQPHGFEKTGASG